MTTHGIFFSSKACFETLKTSPMAAQQRFLQLKSKLSLHNVLFCYQQNLTLSCNARENTKQLNTQPRKIWTSNECVRLSKVAGLLVSSKFSSVDLFSVTFCFAVQEILIFVGGSCGSNWGQKRVDLSEKVGQQVVGGGAAQVGRGLGRGGPVGRGLSTFPVAVQEQHFRMTEAS